MKWTWHHSKLAVEEVSFFDGLKSGTPSTIIYTRWSSRRYELGCDAPVVANVGRELSLLKTAIDMANADYLSFFSMERTGAPLPTAGSGVPGVRTELALIVLRDPCVVTLFEIIKSFFLSIDLSYFRQQHNTDYVFTTAQQFNALAKGKRRSSREITKAVPKTIVWIPSDAFCGESIVMNLE